MLKNWAIKVRSCFLAILLSFFIINVKAENILLKYKKFIGIKILAWKWKVIKNYKRVVKIEWREIITIKKVIKKEIKDIKKKEIDWIKGYRIKINFKITWIMFISRFSKKSYLKWWRYC
jgi:hypothetical protein